MYYMHSAPISKHLQNQYVIEAECLRDGRQPLATDPIRMKQTVDLAPPNARFEGWAALSGG